MKIKLPTLCVLSLFLFQLVSFRIQAQVVANFSATPSTGCAPLSINFKDLSSGSPTSWLWSFGISGNTSTSQNPSAVYSIPGTYTVSLVSSKSGSSSTKTSIITVYANPIADFTISATTACVGTTIKFTNSSTIGGGPIVKWDWDFGDGIVLNNNVTGIATHSFSTTGVFKITEIITDSHGCSHNTFKNVTIIASPVASFTGSPLSSCTAPLTVNFTNNSTGTGLTYSWDFGDGTPKSSVTNPSHTYPTMGSFTVKLIVTQGACTDSVVKINYVIVKNIVANFSADVSSGCVGTAVTFTDTSVPLSTSSTWNFGDGSPTSSVLKPTHTYSAPGTYTVTLNATSGGCSDSEIKIAYITIYPSPVVAFTANNTKSCKAPFTVSFTDQSTNSTSWLWNFGDGTPTSSSQNPSHTYNATGTYTVTLTVTSANGCMSTLVKNNYIVISPPTASLTATPREGCVPLLVNFTSTSISTDPITSYYWDFGNGITSTTATPTTSNTYNATGYYTVKLIITTASGCKDSITKNSYIRVGNKPTANFNIVDPTVCYGVNAQYNNLSIGADSLFWQWGDGGTLNSKLPAANPIDHFYADTGKFTVTLIAYDKGCPDTLKKIDIVRIMPPKPVFSYKLNCTNRYSVAFTDASWGADSLSWDFGDGTPLVADLLTPTHIYTTRGLKTVKLTAFNSVTGCSFSTTLSFTIADPIAKITSQQNGCYPFPVTFTSNTSQDANTFLWTFGDGTPTSTLASPPIHNYALPGTYTVTLIVTDINGCKNTTTKVIVAQGPVPDFIANVTTGCAPLAVIFTDKSTSDSTLLSWTWDFGDGSAPQTIGVNNVSHTFTAIGSYSVKMTVTDKNGCIKSVTKNNYILPSFPIPKFVIQQDSFACKNEVLTFNAATTNAVTPATYFWKFGDGTTGTGTPITHSYPLENTYTITLVVKDKNGCTDSVKHSILIQHPTVAFDSIIKNQSCGNVQIQFNDKSTGLGSPYTYSWNFGDGGTATISNPYKTYTIPGTYSVTLTVTNSGGCSTTITKNNLVVVPGPIGTFSFTPNNGCRPLTVTYTALSNNTDTYTWDFGDGNVLTNAGNIVTHTYTKDGIHTPILLLGDTLSNGTYCNLPAPTAGTVTITSFIHVNIDSTIIHAAEDETITITSTIGGLTGSPIYSWTPTTGLSCTDCQTPMVTGDGTGASITYILTVTDPGGCIGDDSVTIVFPQCMDDDFIAPNVFTPNNDMVNDYFDVRGLCKKSTYHISIYNRWGAEVFSTDNRSNSWDGHITSGLEASEGVYYYIITLNDKPFAGFLHLMR